MSSVRPLPEVLSEISDSRQPGGKRHEFAAVLLLICAAMLCGRRSPNQIASCGSVRIASS